MRYREIIENIEDGYFEVDLHGKFTYVNDYICRYLGISREELLKKKYMDILAKDTVQEVYEIFTEVYSKNLTKATFESEVIRNDGIKRIFEGSFYLKYDVNKKKVGFYGFTRDVTENKASEKKLRESEERYRLITINSQDIVYTLDMNLRNTYISPSVYNVLGYDTDEAMLMKVKDFVHMEDIEKITRIYEEEFKLENKKGNSLDWNRKRVFDVREKHKDGRFITIENTVSWLRDENGDAIGILGVARDISEKKEAEQKLKQSEEKYREAYNRAEFYKDLFYHDINNILSNIKLSIDLSEIYFSEPNREKDIKGLYNVIREQFVKGTKLVANVKKLSQLEDSKTSLKSMDALKILNDSIKTIRNNPRSKKINIKVEKKEEEALVFANEFLIDIFDNLILNSIKYNDKPIIEILIKISNESKEGVSYIKFEFIDNGIGVINEKKSLIFKERFSKEDGSKGLGFGLTLVKKIIESYDGRIWVEDKVKGDYTKGSNFIFLIPEII